MPEPADPFLPGDAGSIAVVTLFYGLRRAGAGMVAAALMVAAQVALTGMANEEQQRQDPPTG
jgi:hypothetical protein